MQRFPSPTFNSSPLGAVPPFSFMPGSGACIAQQLLSQSVDSHCSEAIFSPPIVGNKSVVCLLCDFNRTPMWAPPALDCLACPGKHAPMDAADFTDNEEDSIEDGSRVVPRKRRYLKKDATPLWHLLTHTPANKCCPTCNHSKAQQVRNIRGPEGDTHKDECFGDTATAD